MAKKKKKEEKEEKKIYGEISGPYTQKSIKQRIEALFLENVGKIITREQILKVAIDPVTGKEPENWHQRLSELRTDDGYTILSWRNRGWLQVQEYLMASSEKRPAAGKRVKPTLITWKKILKRAKNACEWNEGGIVCGLKEGEVDPIGGGKVILTPDHKNPHSVHPNSDPNDAKQWQALCGRHQVIKKNYWDTNTGKMNVYAIIQSATYTEKEIVFKFLLDFFGYVMDDDAIISKFTK
ncbi:MAG: restriction endonuclease [Bacteroidota bacterium]